MSKPCKDCTAQGVTTKRPAPHPGPRCHTHHRQVRKERRTKAHGSHIERTYGITADEYWRLYEHQGGRCFICQRATGRSRRLAVDHDHATGEVRGLLCSGGCNKMLGHLRDDMAAVARIAMYLQNPPARRAFGGPRYVPPQV